MSEISFGDSFDISSALTELGILGLSELGSRRSPRSGKQASEVSGKTEERAEIILPLCVFLSGMSTLIYQVAWQRLLVRLVGAALPATTIVVSVFMAGLSLGALVAGRQSRFMRKPLKTYSHLELALAATGFLIPWVTTQRTFQLFLSLIASATAALFHADASHALIEPQGCFLINTMLVIIVCAVVLAPAIVMGATLPVAVEATANLESTICTGRVSKLYLLNVAGAAVGALVCAFVLLPLSGLNNTVRAAAALNLIASLLLTWLNTMRILAGKRVTRQEEVYGAEPAKTGETIAVAPMPARCSKSIVAVSSFVFLALEVTWSRLFALVLGSSTYALGCVLAFCLVGMYLGAQITQSVAKHKLPTLLKLGDIFVAATITTGLSLLFMAKMPALLISLEQAFGSGTAPFAVFILARVILGGFLILPQTTLLGMVLPLVLFETVRSAKSAAASIGDLLAISTIASIAGTVAAGCFFIPHAISWLGVSGMQNTVIIVGAAEAALAAFALWQNTRLASANGATKLSLADGPSEMPPPAGGASENSPHQKHYWLSLVGLVAGVILLVFHPIWQPSVMSSGVSFFSLSTLPELDRDKFGALLEKTGNQDSSLLYYKEGATATVTVGVAPSNNVVYLKNDGKIEAAVPDNPDKPSQGSDEPTQVMLGALPSLVAATPIEKAFLIGYGTGTTAGALLTFSHLQTLTIAEIEPAIYDTDRYFQQSNNRPLRKIWQTSNRVLKECADARNLLSMSAEPYDAIVSQPAEPWLCGSSDLYSWEFFRLVRAKLRPHGIFCQWIQLYSINPVYLSIELRTFHDVFPNMLIFHAPRAGEIILLGFEDNYERVKASAVLERFEENTVRTCLSRAGINTPQQVLSNFVADGPSVTKFCLLQEWHTGKKQMNSDNNMLLEYALPPRLLEDGEVISKNLAALGISND